MPPRQPLDVARELLDAFEHSGRVNEHLVTLLPATLWREPPPGGRGRTIAAIVVHMHGVRRVFARMGGAGPPGEPLNRMRSTPAQARRALRQSTQALATLFRASLARGEARVRGMPRRTVNMIAYLIEHDAHHRGQICWLARALGYQLSTDDVMKIWGWKKLD